MLFCKILPENEIIMVVRASWVRAEGWSDGITWEANSIRGAKRGAKDTAPRQSLWI